MPTEIRGWISLSYGIRGFVEAILDGNHVFIINLSLFNDKGPIDPNDLTDGEDHEFHGEACKIIFDCVKNTKYFPVFNIGSHCDLGEEYDSSFE